MNRQFNLKTEIPISRRWTFLKKFIYMIQINSYSIKYSPLLISSGTREFAQRIKNPPYYENKENISFPANSLSICGTFLNCSGLYELSVLYN